MIESIKESATLILLILIIAILFSYISAATYSLLDTDAKCLSSGYPESTIDMKLNGYCIDRYTDRKQKSFPVEDSQK